jgi:hypothetical protein
MAGLLEPIGRSWVNMAGNRVDDGVELREREAILLRIMYLVNEFGVAFAIPTRILSRSVLHCLCQGP